MPGAATGLRRRSQSAWHGSAGDDAKVLPAVSAPTLAPAINWINGMPRLTGRASERAGASRRFYGPREAAAHNLPVIGAEAEDSLQSVHHRSSALSRRWSASPSGLRD